MKLLTRLVGVVLLGGMVFAGDKNSAQEILQAADAYRGAWDSYEVQVRITNYRNEVADEHRFQVYLKGTEKTLVRFLDAREKGRELLMLADDMWIFLPNTQRPVRITPLQRLVGNASNGDVARTNYSSDYAPAVLRTEQVGEAECYVLELLAQRKGATYQKVQYWVGVANGRPRKAEYFLASGKKFKTATFDRYELVEGRYVLALMTIVDLSGRQERTTMEYSGYKPRALPDKMFNKMQLGQ